MITMLKQMWSMLTIFFAAGEDVALACKELSSYAREGAEDFRKEAELQRAQARKQLQARISQAGIE